MYVRFPLSWKLSCITPVYKQKGSVTDPRFYSPITVLPILAMVFEWVIYSQIYHHMFQLLNLEGTGAQDCRTAIAFTTIQALEHLEECRIICLDIHRAFDSVWWAGLLKHLWSTGLRSKAYGLLCSYLCNRSLFVVAHGDTSSQWNFTAGVPQGGVWSSILFNLYIQHLTKQVLHCNLFEYADDSSLVKVIKNKENRIAAAEEMIADLNYVFSWGGVWNINNFEPVKCHSLSVSLKVDVECHPLYLWTPFPSMRLII